MTLTPEVQYAIQPVINMMLRQQEAINRLERSVRAAQLPYSSIEGNTLTVNDSSGNPQLSVGLQSDGTFAVTNPVSSVPPGPSTPVVSGGVLGLYVAWDGFMSDGTLPLSDFSQLQVHCSATANFTPSTATLVGTMTAAGLFGIGSLIAGTTYYVALVAVTASGQVGSPSAESSGVPQSVPANIPPGSITGGQVATGTITGGNIAAGTITASNIAANTITATQLAAGIVYATIVDGTTITGASFVGTGTTGQVLIYNGTPAVGNLLVSISGVLGSDSFGNPYNPGIGLNGQGNFFRMATLDANEFAISALGVGHQGTGVTRQLVTTLASSSLATSAAASMQLTSQSYDGTVPANVQFFQNAQVFGTLGFGATGLQSVFGTDSSGYPQVTDLAGVQYNLSVAKPCNPGVGGTYPIAVTNTTLTSLGFMQVLANDVTGIGPVYFTDAAGFFSTGSSVPSSATFTVFWGGLAGNTLASLAIPGTILASASQLGWWVEAKVYWVSSTEAVTKLKVGWHTATGASGSAEYFVIGDVTSLVTNVNKNLSLGFQWGSAPTSTNLTCTAFQAGRVA